MEERVRKMQKLRCHSCGMELTKGSLKYILEIRSFADFDGYLEDYDGDIEDGINDLLDAMESADPKAMEEDVSKEQLFILCKACRDRFTSDPLQTGKAHVDGDEVKGTVH